MTASRRLFLGYITGTSRMSLYCVLPWGDHAAPFTCAHDAMGLAQFKCILSPQLQRADPRLRWCQSRLMKGSYGSLLNSVFWRHASFGWGLVGSTGTLALALCPFLIIIVSGSGNSSGSLHNDYEFQMSYLGSMFSGLQL
ncbi:predicted protein [Lichtheimia corymbifera JMRC:FSU:9682]|uniref:Uncharacterized protein n=1 Tax=Lichtheimia corymbifera JMRC:FSU:9682 TaxID=1263082 RepID=A0A068SG26_9FUNG|nr:predicted protein [Lichtheimia corymbifera JMRC:FSU:9682]